MAGIYIFSDHRNLAAELIGFAKSFAKEAIVLTLDKSDADALQNSGADKIMLINGNSEIIENYAKAIAALLKEEAAELFAVGATPRGRDLAAKVAGYLDCAMVSDLAEISFGDTNISVTKMMYGGAVQQTEILDNLGLVTVPAGKFEPVSGSATISSLNLEADTRVSLVEISPMVRETVDLSIAEKIVCIGMSMGKEEDLQIAKNLAHTIGAELACTRGIAEERRWMPVETYIGISGAIVKPKLYISMGVSGQIQHVFGIRDSQIIVAIDTNEKAPIFKAADYGIVGDMYELIPALTAALK